MAYTPTEWRKDDLITASKMNKIEHQLAENTSDLDDIKNGVTVPTYDEFEDLANEINNIQENMNDLTVLGKNLFDGIWTEGYFINNINGELAEGTSYKVTEYIPIKANTEYIISAYNGSTETTNGLRYAIYNSNKTFLSGAANTASFITDATAAYIRFSLLKTLTNAQLETGNTVTEYEAYKKVLDPAKIWSNEIETKVEDMIETTPLSISPSDTTFFKPSPNLFDPQTAVANELVVQTTGAFSAVDGHTRSGYIPITGGKTYSFTSSIGNTNLYMRYAFYNSTKTFISGEYAYLSTLDHVTAPMNAAYIAVSVSTGTMPFMVAESDTIPAYYPYNYTYIDPQYIVGEQASDIIINLPKKVYATEGIELNIYFENITEDWTRYKWNVDCTVGKQMERGYTITPTSSQAGTYTLSITATTSDGVYKRANTSLIITAANAGSGKTTSLLVLGDSTTANGIAVTKLAENFTNDVMTLTLLGTLGTSPYKHEGRSGWTFYQYFHTSSENAFYHNSTFEAPYYFQNNGVSVPDWFFINLGINDVFNYTNDNDLEDAIDSAIGLCNDMITSIKAVSSNIKVGVCLTIPPNHSQDAFGKAYSCNQSRDRYKHNNTLWVKRQIAEYDGRELTDSIYVIPIHTALDTIYNMGMETLPVNARNTIVTYESPIGNGGVHPVESGYWQIADVYTAFLKGNT